MKILCTDASLKDMGYRYLFKDGPPKIEDI
jgi:hypothetical protein